MAHASKEYALVVRNLQEIIGDEELKTCLSRSATKPFEVYWGTATTGKPHVAYFVPIIKIADMLHAGAKVTILFADLHAYLDNMKSPWSILYHRATYYETVIKGMLEAVGVSLDQLHFVRGSEYELSKAYSEDVYKIAADTSIRDARKAGAEVVKQVSNPLISGLLYPLLQALDEEYLHVDAQFGGVDQRKIFMICERALPRLGYKKRVHLMNPMVPGLTGGKMSASEADSKIDMLEPSEGVRRKLERATCPPGLTAAEGNGVLAFMKFVIFPFVSLSSGGGGGVAIDGRTFRDYADLEGAYVSGSVSSEALKNCVFEHLDSRMAVVRDKFAEPRFAKLMTDAYPDEASCAARHATESSSSAASPLTGCDDEMARVVGAKLATTEAGMRSLAGGSAAAVARLLPVLDARSLDERVRKTNRRCIRCLWSITPTGMPHLGHSVPLRVLAHLSRIAGIHVVVLVDDIAAFLEGSCAWDLLEARSAFTEEMVRGVFRAHGGDETALTVFRGTEYKCQGTFMLDFYRMVSLVPEQEAAICSGMSPASLQDSTDDTQTKVTTTISGGGGLNLGCLLLPCLNLLDSFHLGADIRLASPQQTERRRIFAEQFLPKFDLTGRHLQPFFVSHAMLPALAAPDADSTAPMRGFLSTLSEPQAATACLPLIEPPVPGVPGVSILPGLKKRIRQSFCEPGNVNVNPPLEIFKLTVLPDLKENEGLVIRRPAQHGGPIELPASLSKDQLASKLEDLFVRQDLHSGDLKAALEQQLTQGLLARLTTSFPSLERLGKLLDAAYPVAGKKKTKNIKSNPKNSKATAVATDHGKKPEGDLHQTHQPREKPSRASKRGDFDPSLLAVQVGTITEVKPHPKSPSYNICRVSFGGASESAKLAVVGLPASLLHGVTALFLTNLLPTSIHGVDSEVKLVCVPSMPKNGGDVPLCVKGYPGDRLPFESLSGKGSKHPAVAASVTVDPEGHPGWRTFFADLVFEPTGSLTWKNSWRLSFCV